MEQIRLIYLNRLTIDEELQRQLMEIDPTIEFHTDVLSCLDFIQSIVDQPLFLIISNEYLVDLIELMDSFQSIIAIFIYDGDNQLHDTTRKDSKIIGYYSKTSDLLKSIEDQLQSLEKQIFAYSLFDSKQSLTKESASCLWYYLLMDILQEIPSVHPNHSTEQEIQAYIKDDSVSKIFNRALRTRSIEQLFIHRSSIVDLCLTIERGTERLKDEEYLIVYRAQMMNKEKINKLKLHLGSCLCPRGFLFASSDRIRALTIFEQDFTLGERVLFEIHVDFSIASIELIEIPSADEEKELLFSINSIFILQSIDYDSIDQLWHVKMSANGKRRKSFDEYIQYLHKQMHISSSIVCFTRLLWQELAQIEQAENFCQILLETLPDTHPNLAEIYIELGNIKEQRGEYYLALNYYQTALDLQRKQNPHEHFIHACLLNRIGRVYQHMNNLDRAMEFYQQSLDIYQKIALPVTSEQLDVVIQFCEEKFSLFDTHPNRTHLLILLASLYEEKSPQQADQYYQQAVTILEQHPTDQIFDKSLSTMINFYWKCRMFDRALVCQMKLLHLRRSNRRAHDQEIAYALRGVGRLYRAMNRFEQALNYFDESLSIFRQNFPSEHLDVRTIEKEIFDLKSILKSISSTAQEDYDYRRSSNAHKQWPMLADIPSSIGNDHRSNSVSKSGACLIL